MRTTIHSLWERRKERRRKKLEGQRALEQEIERARAKAPQRRGRASRLASDFLGMLPEKPARDP